MGKYDDAIGSIELKVSVKEVLDEASSNEVDKKLKEKQKNREQEVKIKISAEDALKDLERLNKAAKDTKKNLENAVSSGKGFNVIKRYETSMGAIKQQMEALPDSIKKNNKLYKESQTIFKDTDKILKKLTVTQKELNAAQKDNVGTKSTAKKSEKALEKQIELTDQQAEKSEAATKAIVDGAKKQAKAQTEVAKAIALTEKQMESAIKRYNKWQMEAGYYHKTIGLGEDDGATKGWNLRDMVAEAKSTIENELDIGIGNGDLSSRRPVINGLQRFINAYEKYIADMYTTVDHFEAGKYNNTPALKESIKLTDQQEKTTKKVSYSINTLISSLNNLSTFNGDPLSEIVKSVISGEEIISSEVQEILKNLNLLNDTGAFSGKFITEGMNNSGVVTNGKHAIVERDADVYAEYDYYDFEFGKGADTYLENLIAKEKEAAKQGVNLARVLDVVKSKTRFDGKDLFYEIQEFAPGQQIHTFDESKKTLKGFEQECKRVVGATDAQIKKLMSDITKLNELGFLIDFSPANILYDAEKGFTLIDLELRDLGTSARTTTELMQGLFYCLTGFEDNIDSVISGTKDASKWISSMGSVYKRLSDVFNKDELKFSGDFNKYIVQSQNEQHKIIESTTKSLERQDKVYKTISVQKDNTFPKNEQMKKLAVEATTVAIEEQVDGMGKLTQLIDELTSKYGKNSFDNIFGSTIVDFGTLNASNAIGLYDALIERENKHIIQLQREARQREVNRRHIEEFVGYFKENQEKITAIPNGLQQYGILVAEISRGALNAKDAISQLNNEIEKSKAPTVVGISQPTTPKSITVDTPPTVVGITQPTTPKGITVDSLAEYKSSFSDQEMKSILKGIDINAIAKTFNIIGEERQVLAEELKTLASMTAEMTAGKFDSNLYDKQYQKVEQMIISNGKNAIQNEKKFEKFLNYIGDSVIKYTDTDAKELTPDEWQPILKRFGVAKGKRPALISQDIGRAVDSFYDEMIDTVGEVGYLKREITNSHQRFKAVVQTLELAYDEKSTHRKNEYKSLDQSDRQEIGGEIGLFLGKAYDNAAKMAEETLKIEQKTTKEKEGQIGLIENAAKKTKEQAKAEKEAAKAAAELAKRKEKVNNLLGVGLAEEVSIDEFVRQGVNKSIEQLRNSDNSGKNVINFKGVFNGEDLLDQVNDAVHKITKQTNFEIDKFNIGKSDASFKLINQETGFAIEQTYRLKDATEELGYATIEVTNRISGSMTAARKNLTGLISEYNKIDLEKQKASLSGQDTSIYDREQEITLTKIINLLDLVELSEKEQIELKKIDNQLIQQKAKLIETATQKEKQAQEEILKITNNVSQQINEWTSKGFFGKTLSSGKLVDGVFSSDLQNEINNFQSSLSHLDENSDLPKIKKQWEDVSAKARDAIKANQEYSNSFYKNEFQNNYKYNNGKTAQDQTTFDSMRDFYNKQEQDAQNFNNNIKRIYSDLMLAMKQMNSLDSGINNLTLKDNGSGIYDKSIATLQEKKSALVATMRTLNAEINTMFGMPDDNYGIPTMLEKARDKAILTNEEIDKLDDLFRQADKASYDFAATLTSKIQPTIEKLASLKQMAIDGKITNSDAVGSILSMEGTLKSKMANFNKYEDASSASEVLKYNSAISEQVTLLDQLARKEAQYFAGKTQYKQNTTMSTLAKETEEQANKVSDAQKKLKNAANQFAKESGASGAIVTNFVQGADGIAKLDFSVLDTGTNSVRKFRMEMGSLTDSTYVTETAVKNSMSGIQAGVKQLESVSNLVQKLNLSGISTSNSSEAVTNLLNIQQKLNSELSKGANADQTTITKLANDAKLSVAEVQKLYNQMQKVQSIAKGNGGYKLDNINLNKDAYMELTNSVKNFAKSFPDSTLSIGKFNEAAGTLDFSLVKANGSATTFKATMESMSGTVAAQRTGVKQVNTALDTFAKTAKHAGRQLVTAFVGYNVFFKVVSEIRKGIGYVKEIDLAMTELKKVTDETEETYDNFLKTASKTANVIGSTVSEFTEATANFARLGYSVEESAEMAKSAVVYKNVADGLDTIDESTESIISTMKAFGIESSGTMGIIDRFNEVGNNFAITSAGIGDALQRSASALYEGGNTIDESIGLVTAANSVIQNPEQVGKLLPSNIVIYC